MGLPRDPKSLKSLIDDSMERIGSVIRETLRLNLGVLGEPFAVSQIRLTGDGRGGAFLVLRLMGARKGWTRRVKGDGEGEG